MRQIDAGSHGTCLRFTPDEVRQALYAYAMENHKEDMPFMFDHIEVKLNNDPQNPNDGSADVFCVPL